MIVHQHRFLIHVRNYLKHVVIHLQFSLLTNPITSLQHIIIMDSDGIILGYDFEMMLYFSERSAEDIDAKTIFPVNSIWVDKSKLMKSVEDYACIKGFVAVSNRCKICCNRSGKYIPKVKDGIVPAKRTLQGGDLNVGCPWRVNYEALVRSHDINNKLRPCFDRNNSVKITETCFEHSQLCDLSPQGQIFANSRAGHYVDNVHRKVLYDLFMYQLNRGKIESSYINKKTGMHLASP